MDSGPAQDREPPAFDPTVANPARRCNYWLGGKDNFEADRRSGDQIEEAFPHIRTAAAQNRMFLLRAVRYLAQEEGIRQFLDLGAGLPAADNTHEVAQRVDPTARVVYVDHDPLVLTHARALLTSSPEGATAYLQADVRDPEQILTSDEVTGTLDLSRPVGLLLVAVLHFVRDDGRAYRAVATLMDRLAPGSYLVLSHATDELLSPDVAAQLKSIDARVGTGIAGRSGKQIEQFFTGLQFAEPGLTVVSNWRPELGGKRPSPDQVSIYGGVARKPGHR